MRQIKDLQVEVKNALKSYPETRDSDERLFYAVAVGAGLNLKELTAHRMLRMMEAGVLPKWESISRARRKVQEENPDLRGKTYDFRQGAAKAISSEMRDSIH